MTGMILSQRRRDVPPYMRYITDRLDAAARDETPVTQDALFRLCLHPRPLQLFFAEYLTESLLIKEPHIRDHSVDELIDKLRDENDFLTEAPPAWKRNGGTFAMTKDQFDIAVPGMKNAHVQGVALLLQAGTDTYIKELIAILDQDYKVSWQADSYERSTLKSLSMGPNFQSFWKELLPFFAYDHQTSADAVCPFGKTFAMARDNHAFKAQITVLSDARIPSECPAQHMIKHLLNTDFIEQPDGTLRIAPNPRAGALPAYIYRKLAAQSPTSQAHMAQTLG